MVRLSLVGPPSRAPADNRRFRAVPSCLVPMSAGTVRIRAVYILNSGELQSQGFNRCDELSGVSYRTGLQRSTISAAEQQQQEVWSHASGMSAAFAAGLLRHRGAVDHLVSQRSPRASDAALLNSSTQQRSNLQH